MTQGRDVSWLTPPTETEPRGAEPPLLVWAVVFLAMAALVEWAAAGLLWTVSRDHAESVYPYLMVDVALGVIAAMSLTAAVFALLVWWQHRSTRAPRGWALLAAVAAVAVASVLAMQAILVATSSIAADEGVRRELARATACSRDEVALLVEFHDDLVTAERGWPAEDRPPGRPLGYPDGRCLMELPDMGLGKVVDLIGEMGWAVVAEDDHSFTFERNGNYVLVFRDPDRRQFWEPMAEVVP